MCLGGVSIRGETGRCRSPVLGLDIFFFVPGIELSTCGACEADAGTTELNPWLLGLDFDW